MTPVEVSDIWGPFLPRPHWHTTCPLPLIAVTFLAVSVNDRDGCHGHLDLLTRDNYFPNCVRSLLKTILRILVPGCSLVFFLFILKSVCVFLACRQEDGGREIQSNPCVCDAFTLK